MAIILRTPEEIGKRLRIPHPIHSGYDLISDRIKIRMDHYSRDRFASDYLDFPYTLEALANKLQEMQIALEKE